MLRKPYRFVVLVCAAALGTALLAGRAPRPCPSAQQGVTKDSSTWSCWSPTSTACARRA